MGIFLFFRHHAPERDGVGKHKRERDKQNRQHHRDPVCREGIENLRQGNLKQFHTADGAVAAVQPKVREARRHVEKPGPRAGAHKLCGSSSAGKHHGRNGNPFSFPGGLQSRHDSIDFKQHTEKENKQNSKNQQKGQRMQHDLVEVFRCHITRSQLF